MKLSMSLIVFVLLFVGCPNSDSTNIESSTKEDIERYESLMKKYDEQAKRYDALLNRWEDQADRYDAVLKKLEALPNSKE
jgi:hypothetical protein